MLLDKIKVTILITSYNRINDLKETINKCDDISYSNTEILIVDNGSTDGSDIFIKNLPDKYKKILIKDNRGSVYAHNLGMKNSSGSYIFTLDDDCFIKPDIIKPCIDIFEKYPNLGAIGFGFQNPNVYFDENQYLKKTNFNLNEIQNTKLSYQIIATSGAVFRKKALDKSKYYDLNFYWCDDVVLSMGLIANKFNTIKISKFIAYHKSSPSNRNLDHRRYHIMQGQIWLYIKFYPLTKFLINVFKLVFFSIYKGVLNKKFVYLSALFGSLKKIDNFFKTRKVIHSKIIDGLNKPEDSNFE